MKYVKVALLICLGCFVFVSACKNDKEKEAAESTVPVIYYKVKSTWPHDTEAFTQGLVVHNGLLYESTGQEGKSWIGIVDVKTGEADKKVILDDKYFGEGITILNNKIYQLTYTTKVGFVYDLSTYEKIREFPQPLKEGWGITHDNKNLIVSEGTEKLFFLDTTTLKPVRSIVVKDDQGPVTKLNELEYVDGFIYANIWETNRIVKINPADGTVVGRLDLTALAQNAALRNPEANVLNGIAYHPGTKLFLVTGKNWPSIYILQLNQ
ncbi:MAG TPA: glutaminyl-peptide cyclotransferase [Chryseosolibacter sp.]|nr:glutaminyl-peptide cyclotransferase [Chryseosolibacter sp.]